MVNTHNSSCAEVQMVLSVTVCVVLNSIHWGGSICVRLRHCPILLRLNCERLDSISVGRGRIILVLVLLIGDVVHLERGDLWQISDGLLIVLTVLHSVCS